MHRLTAKSKTKPSFVAAARGKPSQGRPTLPGPVAQTPAARLRGPLPGPSAVRLRLRRNDPDARRPRRRQPLCRL